MKCQLLYVIIEEQVIHYPSKLVSGKQQLDPKARIQRNGIIPLHCISRLGRNQRLKNGATICYGLVNSHHPRLRDFHGFPVRRSGDLKIPSKQPESALKSFCSWYSFQGFADPRSQRAPFTPEWESISFELNCSVFGDMMIYRTDAEEHVSLLPCPRNAGTDNNEYLTKLQPTKKSTPNNGLLLEDIFDSLLRITEAPFPHGRKLLEHTPIRLHPPVATKGVQILASRSKGWLFPWREP